MTAKLREGRFGGDANRACRRRRRPCPAVSAPRPRTAVTAQPNVRPSRLLVLPGGSIRATVVARTYVFATVNAANINSWRATVGACRKGGAPRLHGDQSTVHTPPS